jgi:hypothetical protein
MGEEDVAALEAICRSRSEPASLVERARILLAYRKDPSFFQTAQRCVERALAYGAMAALDDLPRPGRERTITEEAKARLCGLGLPQGQRIRLSARTMDDAPLAGHAREHGPAEGHPCLAKLAQGHVVQNPQRAGDQATQGPLLPGTPRPGVQAEDGEGFVRLSRGQAH